MSNADGTYECAHAGCHCRVADDATHPKDNDGLIYCSEACKAGRGCRHDGCTCGNEG